MRLEAQDRRRKTVLDRQHETGFMEQETGDRRREKGEGRQEICGNGHATGSVRQKDLRGDRRRDREYKRQGTG